ncbi:MAG: DUF91 domain-containing protein [Bacteroidetes bacterium]|nr:DUF91 domain-containing protein [Bacteroidota bacterium]
MSDLKLFKLNKNKAEELEAVFFTFEKSLQTLIENNLEEIFGIKFLDTEYSTGKEHGGRIDTLGIDENNCPVIIEYKRSINENVINQGLFYLDWLMDHKAEFKLLVIEKVGKDYTEKIEWSSPRLLCIANNFTKYDEHAVKQINRNIELIRYRKYDDDMLLFELVNSQTATGHIETDDKKKNTIYKTFGEYLKQADSKLTDLYHSIQNFILNLGDDVQEKELKYYKAYKRIKNFICLDVKPQTKHILLYLRIDPSKVDLKDGLIRDVSNVGHYGTGDLEIKISTIDDFEQTKYLIMKSYEMG